MKKIDQLARLLANPVVPKASRHWSGSDVLIASAPKADHLWRSFYPRDREVLTEHALEVSYFFEALKDPFDEEALMDHCSKIGSSRAWPPRQMHVFSNGPMRPRIWYVQRSSARHMRWPNRWTKESVPPQWQLKEISSETT
jgi:hypothetical protein